MTKQYKRYNGSCLCGAVTFSFTGLPDDIWFCHCRNCRKSYGTFGAFIGAHRRFTTVTGEENIKEYVSKTGSKRAFCKQCGSAIAWKMNDIKVIYFLLGLIEEDIKPRKARHVWVSDKGKYYDIKDNHKKFDELP